MVGVTLGGCVVKDEPVPVVYAAPTQDSCTPAEYGHPVIEVVDAGDSLWDCYDAARLNGCRGSVEFEVSVDEVGYNTVTLFRGQAAHGLRECISAAVRDAALGPATDCRDRLVPSTTTGFFAWDAGRTEYSWGIANRSAAGTFDPPAGCN
jgi:hypothetical protein